MAGQRLIVEVYETLKLARGDNLLVPSCGLRSNYVTWLTVNSVGSRDEITGTPKQRNTIKYIILISKYLCKKSSNNAAVSSAD